MEDAIERIEQTILNEAKREMPSRKIGEMVMLELKKTRSGRLCALRLGIKSFSDVEDFKDAIREVTKSRFGFWR